MSHIEDCRKGKHHLPHQFTLPHHPHQRRAVWWWLPRQYWLRLRVAPCFNRHNYDHQEILTRNVAIAQARGYEQLEEVQDIKFLIESMKATRCALREDLQFTISAASVKHAKQVTWFTKFATLVCACQHCRRNPGYRRVRRWECQL